MSSEIPPPVDVDGNITVHTYEGLSIPITSQDASGTVLSLATSSYRFIVKGIVDKLLITDPNNSGGKLLVITPSDTEKLGTSNTSFQVMDITNPALPVTVWMGKIKRLIW